MEPNTSTSSPAAWSSPAATAILEQHGEPEPSSARDPSLLSPAFSSTPYPGLVVPALSRSGSGSPWCQQIPPPSSQSPPPSFPTPTVGALPTAGYDLFSNPEATAATPLPTLLGVVGQWEQGEPTWRAASPSVKSAEWPSKEISCFFSRSSSAGALAPQSSDDSDLVGFTTQPSSDSSETALLPQSLRVPSLVAGKSPVDAPLPPIDEEEEIDVSAFLVSDPENQPPNALWTAGWQMSGSRGGAGAGVSWMTPARTGDNWPLKLPPAVARSTCTSSSGSMPMPMPCHARSSSCIGSIGGGMMKPSSQGGGGGASSSNFNGFAQPLPSSSSIPAPLAPNLQGRPLLPVKQEVVEYVDATPRCHPADFISLVDDDEYYGLYHQDGMPCSIPGPLFYPPVPSSRGSLIPLGSSDNSSLNAWASGHSHFASWGSSPSFAPGSWGTRGSSSSRRRPGFPASTPCFDRRTSTSTDDVYGSSSTRASEELYIRGIKFPSTFRLPPLPRAGGAGRGHAGGDAAEIVFTDAEMAIIRKEKNLQELLRTDRKKVKRILYNRAYSAMAKIRKAMQTKELERLVETLELQRTSLCEELQSLEEGSAALRAQKMQMQMTIGELEQQAMLKDAVREVLKAEIQKFNHLKKLN